MLSFKMTFLTLYVQSFYLGWYKINDLNNSLCKYLQIYDLNHDFKYVNELFQFII